MRAAKADCFAPFPFITLAGGHKDRQQEPQSGQPGDDGTVTCSRTFPGAALQPSLGQCPVQTLPLPAIPGLWVPSLAI